MSIHSKKSSPLFSAFKIVLKILAIICWVIALFFCIVSFALISENVPAFLVGLLIFSLPCAFIGCVLWHFSSDKKKKNRTGITEKQYDRQQSEKIIGNTADSSKESSVLNQIQRSDNQSMQSKGKAMVMPRADTLNNQVNYQVDSTFIDAAKTADCAVVDTETTGLGKGSRLLDIGIVLIENERITATFSQLTNPGTANTSGAAAVNHITQDMLYGQPAPSQVLVPVLEAIKGLPLMGHNLAYDISIINNEANLAGIAKLQPSQIYDTMDLSKEMFPDASSHTLASLLDRLGVKEPEQHRALSDALQTWQAYQLLCKMDAPRAETVEERQRSKQRGKAKTNDVMRARYLSGKSSEPVNEKPEGVQLEAHAGENLSGSALYQDVLRKYPRGSYFWVTLSRDFIQSGKYKDYPTVFVYLDGEGIGFLGARLMAKHWGQIPDGSVVALAHTSNCADETQPYKARVELPAAHEPVDLTAYMKVYSNEL
ncbi:3'-5' exonuclease [Bifidobacterium sp. ESL0704]|uniref:3'-5' exonuclease n=1 Tax=Bifidobacterium sp. ESL0704 TaxID=2983219 RepID=UPI0023F90091|nr:3'-5' exonuclease [Bifidobacterium sp. ESL0704]WEV52390.1 3'-5' exonuclease [Bifidobacterium sp. ESL0704]